MHKTQWQLSEIAHCVEHSANSKPLGAESLMKDAAAAAAAAV
jgi:hypothetical protein